MSGPLVRFDWKRPRAPRWLLAVLWAAGVAMLAYRYFDLRLVPFINDEPAFLDAAREQVRSGHWVEVSPLVGNQGLHYGPTVLWFYGLVHLFFGHRPLVHVVAMLTCMTGAHFAFARGLGRRFGSLAGATGLALVASSPYQFFWSRLAWDQSVDVCVAWVLFALCAFDTVTPAVGAFIGVVAGLAVSSHLMALPFAFLLFAFLALDALRRRRWAPLLWAGGATLAANLPYLHYLSRHYHEASPSEPLSWDLVAKFALEPARVSTLNGIEYFFDGAWRSFLDEEHLAKSPWITTDLKASVAAVAAAGLVWTAMARRGRRTHAFFALLAWVGYAFFFGQRRVGDQPHYQFATWWVIPLGLAAAVAAIERRWHWPAVLLAGCIWTVSLAQFSFVVDWMAYVRRHGGTQFVHYGTVVTEQEAILRAICGNPHEHIAVSNDTRVFDLSLRYIASTEPSCRGKKLSFCGSEPCDDGRGVARARVAYSRRESGWLFVDFTD